MERHRVAQPHHVRRHQRLVLQSAGRHQPRSRRPAFKHIIIKPNLVGGLTSAKASYDSVRGRIVSDWKVENGRFKLNVTIPANTTATVCVPTSEACFRSRRRQPAMKAEGVRTSAWRVAARLFEVGSGTYHFTAPL